MNPRISSHYVFDDSRYWRFDRSCPDFYVERRTLGERLVWPGVVAGLIALAVLIILERIPQ